MLLVALFQLKYAQTVKMQDWLQLYPSCLCSCHRKNESELSTATQAKMFYPTHFSLKRCCHKGYHSLLPCDLRQLQTIIGRPWYDCTGQSFAYSARQLRLLCTGKVPTLLFSGPGFVCISGSHCILLPLFTNVLFLKNVSWLIRPEFKLLSDIKKYFFSFLQSGG